ncbi:TPA: CHAP domain-containing protein [Staphylococcus aureus]|nr:CHAP domain-containing protein [Staphylococcus aureus]QOY78494.1 CHAP domain-containing protein [Staphylococcus aureus]HDI7153253.1 CHAP domain-containing protein [Staphylococcus aureus]HEA6080008.1 CHAP domain-containing protein [Staphylococcus aureus]
MKKIVTATIATAGLATIAFAGHDAQAAEQNNNGYNSNDAQSYSYTYTIDAQGNYHYTWTGNWNPSQLTQNNTYYYNNYTNNSQTATNNYYTGGSGASYSTTSNNVHVTTTAAPSSNGRSISNGYASGSNLYTSGQCTYYVFDRVGGKIGSTWGNASNWASAAASSGYTVNNTPKAGAIMQTTQGYYGHVAYVEGVNSNGSVRVSEMNYGHGAGVVTSRTISANQAGSYNFIH